MKKIKWNTHDVSFAHGHHEVLIAKLDNSRVWLSLQAYCTTSTFKADIKNLAQHFGAKLFAEQEGIEPIT